MTELNPKIEDGMVVGLDYSVRLDDGDVIDASEEGNPLQYLQGAGQIIPGLEQALYGMSVGDEKRVVVQPAEGYGPNDPDALRLVAHDAFPEDLELAEGMALQLRDRSGQASTAFVSEMRPDGVLLDFNHPLAGETLHFDVKIASLRPATGEELSHAHVHEDEQES